MHIKKLIEVSLPLDSINKAASYEKMPGIGAHPRGLHLWWARRPLAAARAVLWSSLVDDPSAHPELFPTEEDQARERQRLHALLAELVKWENSNNEELLNQARAEIRKYMGDEKLVFLDPFAGGGSIPLEAQRLGLEAHAHDLNPVAVMINKAMIEIPPKFANLPPVNPESRHSLRGHSWPGVSGLAEDVRYYGQWLKEEAFKRIGHLYPKAKLPQGGEATVIAWIWARTVKCPNPACGCEMPLASSFVLSKKKGREAWIEPVIEGKNISYIVHSGKCPKGGETNKLGKGASFRCPVCGATTEKKYIHDAFMAKSNGAVLMAIVAEGRNGRIYLSPTEEHAKIAESAVPQWEPEEEMNTKCTDLVSGRGYGITHWKQLFTPRQLTALTTCSDLVAEAQAKAEAEAVAAGMADDGIGLADGGRGAKAYGEAVGVYLAFVVDRLADFSTSVSRWSVSNEKAMNLFSKQAIPMTWDFPEVNILGKNVGGVMPTVEYIIKCIVALPYCSNKNIAAQVMAQEGLKNEGIIISTDPPYYDNIGYADLSDFFYIWMRQPLKNIYTQLFTTINTPKVNELVATAYRFDGDKQKAKKFFENGMKQAFGQMHKSARDDVPVTIYYAFKQSETKDIVTAEAYSTGWQTMLTALIEAGFAITGTWPMRTEQTYRSVSMHTNALASSIVLVCRKRSPDAPATSRRAFLAELKKTLPLALKQLQAGNIAPVDLAQAAIGPGMAIFSQYARVLEADGSAMTVRAALQAINAELDSYLSAAEGELDEASRFCLDLYSQYAFNGMKFGEADVLARAKNTSVAGLAAMGLLQAQKGYVRLLTREELPERPADHSPAKCLWLLTQYLVKALESGGVGQCAELAASIGDRAEAARDLAYRLYAIAERQKWSGEAFAYNALVTEWPAVRDMASQMKDVKLEQARLV